MRASACALQARCHPQATSDWLALPAFSLAMALAARHLAHGSSDLAPLLDAYHPYWVVLARTMPRLVTIDLLLAELYAATNGATALPSWTPPGSLLEDEGDA